MANRSKKGEILTTEFIEGHEDQSRRMPQAYIDEYKSYRSKSVDSILGMSLIVVQAEVKLDGPSFNQFLLDVGLDARGSTFRKHKTIGCRYKQLSEIKDRLPFAWTTIYKIAAYNDEKLDQLVKSNMLSPSSTAKDLDAIIPTRRTDKRADKEAARNAAATMSIDVTCLEPDEQGKLYTAIEKCVREYGLTIHFSEALTETIKIESALPMKRAA